MASWDSGYITEINYTYGYYRELSPLFCKFALLNANLEPPKVFENACELGFGQGVSANIHSAASATNWYGTDFNPAQTSYAKNLSLIAQSDGKFYDYGFDEFAELNELPEFDFIGLHGIWSWVDEDCRKAILKVISKKLRVGGVVYISYNTLPGWSDLAPIRELMFQYYKTNTLKGNGVSKNIKDTMEYIENFFKQDPKILKALPSLKARFEALRKKNQDYLAHEYFNDTWEPNYFADVAKDMEKAKLTFACSANYIDHFPFLNFSKEQRETIEAISDPIFKQTVIDYMCNQQFRKDYWVKGARPLTLMERDEQFRQIPIVMAKEEDKISLSIKAPIGTATLNDAVYKPILKQLSDHKIITIGELEKALKRNKAKVSFSQLTQAIMILTQRNGIHLCNDEKTIKKQKSHTNPLNKYLLKQGISGTNINYLASPVTGDGIPFANSHMMYLDAVMEGKKNEGEIIRHTCDILSETKRSIIRDGKVINKENELQKTLSKEVQEFLKTTVPYLQRLEILP